jgi:hypothetical protein
MAMGFPVGHFGMEVLMIKLKYITMQLNSFFENMYRNTDPSL